MGYAKYDPTDEEVNRYAAEVHDYHERVTNLQYHPSDDELKFLVKHLPVEVDGDPTEKFEVSNYKDVPRISTNLIRGGMCLVLAEGLSQKAPKLWKKLQNWGEELGIDWSFLADFLDLQKKIKAKGAVKQDDGDDAKLKPNYTFIADLVAGRPILTHPMRKGGFRLRYGRTRLTGFSTAGMHPATLVVLDKYIAIGTQLKVERPGKAATVSLCDSINGPIVKMKDGSVKYLATESEAKLIAKDVDEIIFLGDILFNYGDFSENGHMLVPAGYCEEWWAQEVEKAEITGISQERVQELINNPLTIFPSLEESLHLNKQFNIPLHPRYTYYWKSVMGTDLSLLKEWFLAGRLSKENGVMKKYILPLQEKFFPAKIVLEEVGIPHTVTNEVMVVINQIECTILDLFFSLSNHSILQNMNFDAKTDALTQLSKTILQRDKCGTFIGARMGRPEKSKMRKMTGSPQVMFPVGNEGDRLRSFQATFEKGEIRGDFPCFFCPACKENTIYIQCERCDGDTQARYYCRICDDMKEPCKHDYVFPYKFQKIDSNHYFQSAMKKLNMKVHPDLIKGVRGTSNKGHVVEHLSKGILRAKHELYVNKDGTTRVDCTEMPITAFKPNEIGTTVEKLKEMGYDKDIYGKSLELEDQIIELKPQDIILPNFKSLEKSCGKVILSIGNFIDDLLTEFYGEKSYYNFKTESDIVGHYVVGLAPHISAGLIGRIIGFSNTQVLLAHPLWHAGLRRDCDGDEAAVMLLLDALLNFSRQYLPERRGAKTMDSPLVLTTILNPAEVDDQVHGLDVVWKYPLELYEAALEYKNPWDVPVEQLKSRLGTPAEFIGFGFTHKVGDLNMGVNCSAYKILPTMKDKLWGQMELARKIRAVDKGDVARMVIEKHLIRDIRGNLRKFSSQKFRCVKCNEKYRRPPLLGCCSKCKGRLIFTISEGSTVKYLGISLELAEKYDFSPYIKQNLAITKNNIDAMFGREKEKQIGLSAFAN